MLVLLTDGAATVSCSRGDDVPPAQTPCQQTPASPKQEPAAGIPTADGEWADSLFVAF